MDRKIVYYPKNQKQQKEQPQEDNLLQDSEFKEDSLVFSQKNYGYHYNRSCSNDSEKVQQILSKRYTPENFERNENVYSVLTASGMLAIDTVLQSIFVSNKWQPCNLIYGDDLYCDTPRLINVFKDQYLFDNLNLHKVKVEDSDYILKLFQSNKLRKKVNILFIESCSNPKGEIIDFSILKQLKNLSQQLYVIVDNSWLTSSIFNPFQFSEVDFVVTSTSKYYSAGSCIGGAILYKSEKFVKIFDQCRLHGHHVSPHHCELILKSLQTMDQRIQKSSLMTVKIAEFLEQLDGVLAVKHPLLKSHSSYAKAIKIFNKDNQKNILGPSVLIFCLQGGKNKVNKYLRNYFKNQDKQFSLKYKTSFGGFDSKIDNWPFEEDGNTWVRLSVGFESFEKQVMEDLQNMIQGYNKK